MTCAWVAEQLDAYEVGGLDAASRQRVEAHLATCAACRERVAAARSADGALRAALAWAEPSPAFAGRVASRARRRILFRRLAIAGAAAAAVVLGVCIALLRGERRREDDQVAVPPEKRSVEEPRVPGGSLLAGEVYDVYGRSARRLVPGRSYAAADPAAVSMDAGSLLLMTHGSQFAPVAGSERGGPRVSLLAGSLVGQVGSRGKEVVIELAPELGGAIVRTKGCEFYSSGFPAHRLAAGVPFPAGSLNLWPEEIRLHVFSGHLDLDLGTQRLALAAGDSAIIAGGVSAGTARVIEERVRELHAALGEDSVRQRELYAWLRDDYARRLLELRSTAREQGLPYLPERVALVEELLGAHSAALGRLETAHPAFFELDAATAELRRLEQLGEEADRTLARFLALMGSEG
ncbi:MAG TPA: zf-HC2 domain-containing protein [Planctomycetota bacterium]|nr:zf-HC2 domain-containing protein [Planctomycetota bacterium]